MKLADLNGDGDSKLCICDFDKKLKVYKGESLLIPIRFKLLKTLGNFFLVSALNVMTAWFRISEITIIFTWSRGFDQ